MSRRWIFGGQRRHQAHRLVSAGARRQANAPLYFTGKVVHGQSRAQDQGDCRRAATACSCSTIAATAAPGLADRAQESRPMRLRPTTTLQAGLASRRAISSPMASRSAPASPRGYPSRAMSKALVLEAPFTSMVDVGRPRCGRVPAQPRHGRTSTAPSTGSARSRCRSYRAWRARQR